MSYVDDIAASYMLIDFVVCPSIEPEAFGRSVIEAAAMQKIVIATNIGAVKDNILDNSTGFLVEPFDVVSLARKISEVIDMPKEERNAFGDNALKFVKSNFSKEKMCEETIKIYEYLMY